MTFILFSALSISWIWSTDWKCRKVLTHFQFIWWFFNCFVYLFVLLWTLTVFLYKYENIYENLSTIRDYIVFLLRIVANSARWFIDTSTINKSIARMSVRSIVRTCSFLHSFILFPLEFLLIVGTIMCFSLCFCFYVSLCIYLEGTPAFLQDWLISGKMSMV